MATGKGALTGQRRETNGAKPAVARLVYGDEIGRENLGMLSAVLLQARNS